MEHTFTVFEKLSDALASCADVSGFLIAIHLNNFVTYGVIAIVMMHGGITIMRICRAHPLRRRHASKFNAIDLDCVCPLPDKLKVSL
jgi:hypothetical protein